VGSVTHRSSTPTAAGAAGVRATRRLEGGRYRVVGFSVFSLPATRVMRGRSLLTFDGLLPGGDIGGLPEGAGGDPRMTHGLVAHERDAGRQIDALVGKL